MQPVRVGEAERLAGRVGGALEPAVAVHGQRGALAARRDDRERLARAVALDPRALAERVDHADEPLGRVVLERLQRLRR